jgi:AraC-like DNA-binding protein
LQAIVNDAHFEIARQLLRDANLPVKDITETLRYSDAAAVARAFRGWARSLSRSALVATAAMVAIDRHP